MAAESPRTDAFRWQKPSRSNVVFPAEMLLTSAKARAAKGKQADGSARTREVKLGCVFTQIGLDKEGRPQGDPDSTTYGGAIESSTLFGWRIYAEALRRGLEQAPTVIVLTDGQRYNRTITQTHFPGAVHIVDLFHAYEHLTLIAQLLCGPEAQSPKAWRDLLEAGDIQRLVSKAGKYLPSSAKAQKTLTKELRYFENNATCMSYAQYRQEDMIRILVDGQEAVVRTARSIFPLVDHANDEPTAELLTQRMQVHEKTAWMLRSLLEK